MYYDFPEQKFQEFVEKIIKEVLGNDYISIHIKNILIKEDENLTSVFCRLIQSNEKEIIEITGNGSGLIDALFNEIVLQLSKKFFSLETLKLEDFSLSVKFKDASRYNKMDAPVEIRTIVCCEKTSSKLYFKAESYSLIVAVVEIVRKTIEFLVNSELSVVQLKKNIDNASKRGRNDLVQNYLKQLVEIINIADYTKTINNLTK